MSNKELAKLIRKHCHLMLDAKVDMCRVTATSKTWEKYKNKYELNYDKLHILLDILENKS